MFTSLNREDSGSDLNLYFSTTISSHLYVNSNIPKSLTNYEYVMQVYQTFEIQTRKGHASLFQTNYLVAPTLENFSQLLPNIAHPPLRELPNLLKKLHYLERATFLVRGHLEDVEFSPTWLSSCCVTSTTQNNRKKRQRTPSDHWMPHEFAFTVVVHDVNDPELNVSFICITPTKSLRKRQKTNDASQISTPLDESAMARHFIEGFFPLTPNKHASLPSSTLFSVEDLYERQYLDKVELVFVLELYRVSGGQVEVVSPVCYLPAN